MAGGRKICPPTFTVRGDTRAVCQMKLLRINHVQLAIPPDREAETRRFYGDVLGLREIPKPAALAARGGASRAPEFL
jgi:hypothetical protein